MARSKLLLIIRAGRQSIHRSYSLISSRLVDILVSAYDASDWRGSDAKFFHTAPGGKFQGIAQFFAANSQLIETHGYFWLFEDHLYLPCRSLEIMLSLLACGDISKEWRAVATRYEETAASFAGLLHLAAAIDWRKR